MGGGSRPSFGIGAMGLGSFGALIGIGSSSMDALMGLLGESSQSYWSGSSGYGYGRPPLGYSSPGFGARGYGPPPYGPPGLWARRLSIQRAIRQADIRIEFELLAATAETCERGLLMSVPRLRGRYRTI
jgi:hypothetical protein